MFASRLISHPRLSARRLLDAAIRQAFDALGPRIRSRFSVQQRYEGFRKLSVPLESRWADPPATLLPLLVRLRQLDILLLLPRAERSRLNRLLPKYGLTVGAPGQPTVVWVNYDKHVDGATQRLDVSEIVDTIVHEAVHAIGTTLGRQAVQLQDADTETCLAEEAYAHAGAAHVHRGLGHREAAHCNAVAALSQAALLADRELADQAIRQGRDAARLLLALPAADTAPDRSGSKRATGRRSKHRARLFPTGVPAA